MTEPTTGDVIIAGTKAVVRWSGPGVPNVADIVNIYLRKGNGPLVLLGSGPNRGKFKALVPADAASGSDYTFVVRRQADPSTFGVSDALVISNVAEQYTFSEPDFLDFWRRGISHTVLWTKPPTAPAGTVTIELWRLNTLVAAYPGQADDGSFDIPIAANQASVGDYRIEITHDADPAFLGASPKFFVSRVEVTPPPEGAVWAVGSSQNVSWTTGAYNAAGTVKLSLRGVSVSFNRSLANNRPYTEGTRSVTVPLDAPSGTYQIQFLYTYTPSGGSEQQVVVNSNVFTVTTAGPPPPPPPPPPPLHFPPPMAAEGARETYVAVRGLPERTELGLFAAMGDGTPVLVAAGVVADGEAFIPVPSDIADGDGALAFGPSALLTLRAFADGVERDVDVRAVTLGSDGSPMDAVRYAAGDVVMVDASKEAQPTTEVSLVNVTPNPTSGAASVRFTLDEAQSVRVAVYDMTGREVATLLDGSTGAGFHEVAVPSALPAGVYLVRIVGADARASVRFTVTR